MAKGKSTNVATSPVSTCALCGKSECDCTFSRRAELLQIVCALVGDNNTIRQFTRDAVVTEAAQYLRLIDEHCKQ